MGSAFLSQVESSVLEHPCGIGTLEDEVRT